MKTIDEIRRENARALAEQAGGNAAFSEIIDRETTQTSRFIGKNHSKNIGDALARHIEECFNKERGWLDQSWTNKVTESNRSAYRAKPENSVTLYSIKQLDKNEQSTKTVICPFPHGPHTYAFTVDGIQGSPTPMHSQHGRAYPIGSVVFVDPDQADQVTNGDPVAAMLTDENTFCFRMLYREGGTEILMPLNPQFPAVNRPYKIIGKVIGAILP
jgi:SOS-response transcriptional repressor LexA